jgi:CheY-like chemotaxis protein
MVQAKSYDLVFMDHMMPEMDGIEAARRIRSLDGDAFRALPIIALSANAVAGMREIFLEAGMNDFITKPIDPKELNRVLMTWLPRKKLFFPGTAAMRPEERRAAAKSGDVAVLDQAAGLASLQGDEASYREILASFQRIHGGDAASAAAMLAQGDAQGARRVAHTLKSSAAMIGAGKLSRAAAEVEKLLAAGDAGREAAERALETMREDLALVSDALARLLPEQHNVEEKALPLDREKARALLDRLEPLLAKGSVECLALTDEIAATLSPLDGVYREFAALLDDLDFSRAWEMVPALRRALGN